MAAAPQYPSLQNPSAPPLAYAPTEGAEGVAPHSPQYSYGNIQPGQLQSQNQPQSPPPPQLAQTDNMLQSKFDFATQTLALKKQNILAQIGNFNPAQRQQIMFQLDQVTLQISNIGMQNNNVQVQPQFQQPQPPPPPQPQPQQPPQQQQQQLQQQMVIPQQQTIQQHQVKVVSDVWGVISTDLVLNEQTNSITRTCRGWREKWMSGFGKQIVETGQYKKWNLKITYKRAIQNNNQLKDGVDVVIGVADASKTHSKNQEFWRKPVSGYGFYAWNGKKFHIQKKGKNYAKRIYVQDTQMNFSVELNLQSKQLCFSVNGVSYGSAFKVDKANYVLAVALLNEDFEVQIV